ncbi:MAG: hypothetical protein WDN04_22545 [Rhodospirillales bacterium]
MRDSEVIAAADQAGIAMVLTACGISAIDARPRETRPVRRLPNAHLHLRGTRIITKLG